MCQRVSLNVQVLQVHRETWVKTRVQKSSTGALQRMHQGSTSPGTERPPNKRQLIPSKNNKKQKTMDTNNDTIITKSSANQTGVDLNPDRLRTNDRTS